MFITTGMHGADQVQFTMHHIVYMYNVMCCKCAVLLAVVTCAYTIIVLCSTQTKRETQLTIDNNLSHGTNHFRKQK